MGVWQRSPAGVAIALANPSADGGFEAALPGDGAADVAGSPYCIRDYVVDDALGGPSRAGGGPRGAGAARRARSSSTSSPTTSPPTIPGSPSTRSASSAGPRETCAATRASFVEVAGRVLANGRDPYSGAWPDVVQLDAFAPELREAAVDTLRDIADQCDGVRCDMAMLMMNDLRPHLGHRAGPAPGHGLLARADRARARTHPGFCFVAEAYWDLEWELSAGLRPLLRQEAVRPPRPRVAQAVRLHLSADGAYQQGLLRFLENHDEPRAASVFSPPQHRAVAVATLTQCGARLVHDGQLEGRRIRLPVFLGASRPRSRTSHWAPSTRACSGHSPTRRSAPARGGSATDGGGPTTTASSASSPGAGRVPRVGWWR